VEGEVYGSFGYDGGLARDAPLNLFRVRRPILRFQARVLLTKVFASRQRRIEKSIQSSLMRRCLRFGFSAG
jgi:hypothetical protein